MPACLKTSAAQSCPPFGSTGSRPGKKPASLRMAVAFTQAGEHQVDGAKLALGHAYGGAAQYFAMWVVASERP